MKRLLDTVARAVTPKRREVEREYALFALLREKILDLEGGHVEVELCGSLARDTHLRGDRDMDIFVFFPKSLSRKAFEREGLRIGKRLFRGRPWKEAYSEHPYIQGEWDDIQVEIVPTYKVKDASKLQSAVDRSPFHNRHMRKHLKVKHKREVRLLKAFLKGTGCYGASVRVDGFSGYLVELLILYHGTFQATLKAAAKWGRETLIDLTKTYSEKQAHKLFTGPLVVIDPVDKKRDVAAALSATTLARFIAASRRFNEKPSARFFFPKATRAWSSAHMKKALKERALAVLEITQPKQALEDIFSGQVKRLGKRIENALVRHGFTLRRRVIEIEEGKGALLFFELEHDTLPPTVVMRGPPVFEEEHAKAFLKKHPKPVSGPRIEEGHWAVEETRKLRGLDAVLNKELTTLARTGKKQLKTALRSRRLYTGAGLLKRARQSREFGQALTRYLNGTELFLD